MTHKQNLHIHSTFCDGKSTPEETVKRAIELGYDSIGFSGHSYMYYSPNYGMTPERENGYKAEIARLREEYAGKLGIFCGIEYDMYSNIDISSYEYAIGSMHYFLVDGKHVGFDRTAEAVKKVIDDCFGGDGMSYAREYYKNLAKLPEYGDFDIIGHFDLITKHCETNDFFDINSEEYLGYAFEAIDRLKGKIPYFEVNTGAISRGYRTTPYPSLPILKRMQKAGFGAVITTDCHNAEQLDCYYDEAIELLKSCGFDEHYVFTGNGFVSDKL